MNLIILQEVRKDNHNIRRGSDLFLLYHSKEYNFIRVDNKVNE